MGVSVFSLNEKRKGGKGGGNTWGTIGGVEGTNALGEKGKGDCGGEREVTDDAGEEGLE